MLTRLATTLEAAPLLRETAPLQRLREIPWLEGVSTPWLRVIAVAGSLVVFFILAWIVDWLLSGVVRRLAARTRTEVDDQILEVSHRPIRNTVMLIGLAVATQLIGLSGRPELWSFAVLKTLAIFIWVGFGLRLSSILLGAISRRSDRLSAVNQRTLPLFDNTMRVLLVSGAIYLMLLCWNINVTAWLASAGIVGIAVGFAAKDTLANLFGGVFIAADAPYQVGDFIVLDTGERGRVTQVGIRSTRLLTRDDVEVTIPNAVMANAKIMNESGGPWEKERVAVRVQAAYGADADLVEEVLLAAADDVPEVCRDPAARVRFRSFGDSGLDFDLLCWIDEPVLRGMVLHSLHRAVYQRFAAAGLEIPFPQRDLWMRGEETEADETGDAADPPASS